MNNGGVIYVVMRQLYAKSFLCKFSAGSLDPVGDLPNPPSCKTYGSNILHSGSYFYYGSTYEYLLAPFTSLPNLYFAKIDLTPLSIIYYATITAHASITNLEI